MDRITVRGRRRIGVSLLTTTVLMAGTAALTTGPASSAEPAGDCATAYPVAEVTDGQAVTGSTVTEGTTPEPFTGEVLGITRDGIAPGVDMIVARLSSPEIDRVGIWQGMSGSPVYADDGRLIGAVAYGMSWGPSPVAGITPFEEMDDYLPGTTPRRVPVSEAEAREIAARSELTAAEAAQGFRQIRMPLGVSGITARRLDALAQTEQFADRRYLPRDSYAMGAAADPGAGPGAETVVAGGNLAAAASYGDITAGGVGTATSVCDGRVVGFGHPANFLGTTSLTMHPAEAVYVQEDPVGPGFKVANFGAPVGTIDGDHLSGISGSFGALPPLTDITSTVTYRDRGRTGSSHVSVPAATAQTTFFQSIANHDVVVDGIIAGSELLTWSITGSDADGTPFEIGMTDRYASSFDITFESAFEVADMAYFLSELEGVRIDDVTLDATVDDDSSTWRVRRLEQRRKGEWVRIGRREPAVVRAGRRLKVQATLRTTGGVTTVVPMRLEVPEDASGRFGGIEVSGGASTWSYLRRAGSVAALAKHVAEMTRNDAIEATLFLEGRRRRGTAIQRGVSDPLDKVVAGRKRASVLIR